jgi:hypothetical protein
MLSFDRLVSEYDLLKLRREVFKEIISVRLRILQTMGALFKDYLPNIFRSKMSKKEDILFSSLSGIGFKKGSMAALADLGAFDLKLFRKGLIDFSVLAENGIKEIVIMEDRDPMFFLNYDGYGDKKRVTLARQNGNSDKWTMDDMKKLILKLHEFGVKVILGFWGNAGNRKGNPFIKKNWENLAPVIPTSDDINPLSIVKDSGGEFMLFADYVVSQYKKMKNDFGFDGLFLGDGLMGCRAFLDVRGPYDVSDFADLWTDFYERIYLGVKEAGGGDTLWAYDCMGNGLGRAMKNGVDLKRLCGFIDNYIFQAYGGDSWGEYMKLPDYNQQRDLKEIASLPPELKEKTRYTVALGDNVEGWYGNLVSIKEKHELLKDHAKKGTLGVWANEMIRALLK